jgi:uncharacterized OsmC-like protein
MTADELRAVQAPLKARYREHPEAAVHTLRARGELAIGEQTCRVETGAGVADAGLHPAVGGDASKACSGNMLLEALAACAGVTLGAVATAMGITVRSGHVVAEADLDFRGTLGVSKDVPVGFSDVRLRFAVDCDADAEQLAKLLTLTERYCVVYQTLKNPPVVAATLSGEPTTGA